LAREPLSSRKLAKLANLTDGTEARSLVRLLRARLDAQGSALQVSEVGGGFRLLTRRAFAPWLQRLRGAPGEVRLSAPAMETLAIVAYRQPVIRVEVEAIRGVGCNELLRQLMERDLLRIVGRSDELGRPFLYGTTRRFLQVFGLRSLDDLPPLVENGPRDVAPPAERGLEGTMGKNDLMSDDPTSGDDSVELGESAEQISQNADEEYFEDGYEDYDDEEDDDEEDDYDEDDYDEEEDEEEYDDDELDDDDEPDDDEELDDDELEDEWEEVDDDYEDEECDDDDDFEYDVEDDDDDDDEEEEYEDDWDGEYEDDEYEYEYDEDEDE
jgi:segregation and condensation protein B